MPAKFNEQLVEGWVGNVLRFRFCHPVLDEYWPSREDRRVAVYVIFQIESPMALYSDAMNRVAARQNHRLHFHVFLSRLSHHQ